MFCPGRCSILTRIARFILESMAALGAESYGRRKHVNPMCTLAASEGRPGKRPPTELEALPGGPSTVIPGTLRLRSQISGTKGPPMVHKCSLSAVRLRTVLLTRCYPV